MLREHMVLEASGLYRVVFTVFSRAPVFALVRFLVQLFVLRHDARISGSEGATGLRTRQLKFRTFV